MERQAGQLGGQIPGGHVDHRHGDRSFAVTAGLLVTHRGVPDPGGIEHAGVRVAERIGGCGQDPWEQPLAEDPALGVAPVGVEPVPDHRIAVSGLVGHQGRDADGHSGEVDGGVAHAGADGNGDLPGIDDPHGRHLLLVSRRLVSRRARRRVREGRLATLRSEDDTPPEPAGSTGRPLTKRRTSVEIPTPDPPSRARLDEWNS